MRIKYQYPYIQKNNGEGSVLSLGGGGVRNSAQCDSSIIRPSSSFPHLRPRRWPQARGGRARVFLDVEHQDAPLNAHGVRPSALQEGDADQRPANSTLLDYRGHDRPAT